MSAYVCEKAHIRYLVTAATMANDGFGPLTYHHRGRIYTVDPSDVDGLSRLGQMLWDANVKSVRCRYPDAPDDELPGARQWPFKYGKHRGFRGDVEPVQVLKSIACYEYQSCEAPDWEASEAYAFCQALRTAMIDMLPGYEAAVWGVPPEIGNEE